LSLEVRAQGFGLRVGLSLNLPAAFSAQHEELGGRAANDTPGMQTIACWLSCSWLQRGRKRVCCVSPLLTRL
jgi:hypothetical protein